MAALLACLLAVMLLSHSTPLPIEHGALTVSAQSHAHACDDHSGPEQAAGHYWTRAGNAPAKFRANRSTLATTGLAVASTVSTHPEGCATCSDGAPRQSAASRPSVLQVFRC